MDFINLEQYNPTQLNAMVTSESTRNLSTSSPFTPEIMVGGGDGLEELHYDVFSGSPLPRFHKHLPSLTKAEMPLGGVLADIYDMRRLRKQRNSIAASINADGEAAAVISSDNPVLVGALGPDRLAKLKGLEAKYQWMGFDQDDYAKGLKSRQSYLAKFLKSPKVANAVKKVHEIEAKVMNDQLGKVTAKMDKLQTNGGKEGTEFQDLETRQTKLQEYAKEIEVPDTVVEAWEKIKGSTDVGEKGELAKEIPSELEETRLVEYLNYKYEKYRNKLGCVNKIEDWEIANDKTDYSTGCSRKATIMGYLFLTAIFVAMLVFLFKQFATEGVFSTNEDDDDVTKMNRQASRGTIASIVVSMSFGIINAIVDGTGNVDPSTSTALFGMLLGGTIGYLADIGLGSDSGLRVYQERGTGDGWRHMFGSLATMKFVRYQITILFDMFVSLILFKPMYEYMTSMSFFKCSDGRKSIANGVCSAAIGMMTFQAYANQTRFQWAYPDPKSESKATWIQGSTMLLATTIMSLVFLGSNTIIGYNPHKIVGLDQATIKSCYMKNGGLNSPSVKLIIVMLTLALLTGLAFKSATDAKLERNLQYFSSDDLIKYVVEKEIKQIEAIPEGERDANEKMIMGFLKDRVMVKLIDPEQITGEESLVPINNLGDIVLQYDKIESSSEETSEETLEEELSEEDRGIVKKRLNEIMTQVKQGALIPIYTPEENIATTQDFIDSGMKGIGIFIVIAILACFGTYATSKHTTAFKKFGPPVGITLLFALASLGPALS